MIRAKRKPRPDGLPIDRTRSRPLVCEPRREESRAHLGFVALHRCCVPRCGHHPVHVHHLRVPGTDAAAGRKASDRYALPVCSLHHQGPGGIHASGGEAEWWAARGVDPLSFARAMVAASVKAGHAPAAWIEGPET